MITHGSLCTGAGGWDLAAEWMGWENRFHCDINPASHRIIKKFWPFSEPFTDIKTSDFRKYENEIDILTGSDPCQPFSYAGSNSGVSDERFIWSSMLRAVKEIRPAYFVNENVEGTISHGVLDRKISDLEAEGYTCWTPFIIPANAFGAMHKRNRVWLVANSERRIQPREESCDRSARRMGRLLEPLAWHSDWEAAVNFFRGVDDGLPRIVDRSDLMRNAIVPQIALHIFKAIIHHENEK